MTVESGERRPVRAQNSMGSHPPPKTTEQLPCPRCESTNTKFCYYNNYNLAQPRHFCKSCRRYWTEGGTLRNVPVGGGTRKSSKRSRSASSSTSSSSSSATSTSNPSTLTHEPESLPAAVPANHDSGSLVPKVEISDDLNLNENLTTVTENGNFISLLNSQEHGFMGLSGYGSGFGLGSYEMGLGFGGRGVWPYPGLGNTSGGSNGGVVAGGTNSGCNAWQLGDVEGGAVVGGLVDGDYLAWPGLAISAPGKGLK